ncbi:hypothetical protein P879_07600 [Paragonimus westermani]|uniref:Uncharacterized protein n=1 Tax=Paragonimus westermani TaxID=34504 RepID=A0A8T0DA03_9TREM|nr:hypothetical protein P879_07600 [Paragonimus westermani]
MSNLTVVTKFSPGNEIPHYHSCYGSPPPPVPSPVSSSPTNLINKCSQTSPSSSAIVAEIGSRSLAPFRTTSEKGLRLETESVVAASLLLIPVKCDVAPRLPENVAPFPRITSLSTSSSSPPSTP